MDRTERRALAGLLDDLRRWVVECAQIRRAAATLPVSGSTSLTDQDEYVVSLVESATADLDAVSPLLRSGWPIGRKKEIATEAAERLTATHRAVVSRYGTDGTGVLLRWYSERGAIEEQQLRTAIQDLRQWQIQAADARRLSTHLPISGPTALESGEEQLAQLVERVGDDVDVAERLIGRAEPPSDRVAASSAARRAVDAHIEMRSARGADRIDAVRRRYIDRAAAERGRLAAAVNALGPWVELSAEIRHVVAHLPTSGPTPLLPAEEQLLRLVERVAGEVASAARLVDDAGSIREGEFVEVSASARRVTQAHEQVVSEFGADRVGVIHRCYLDRATSERQMLNDAIQEVLVWVAHAAEVRKIAAHLPMSGAIDVDAHDEELLGLLEGANADLESARRLARPLGFPTSIDFHAAHGAADRVVNAHRRVILEYKSEGPESVRWKYHYRAGAEREQVETALRELGLTRMLAAKVIHMADHLPLSASYLIEESLGDDLRGLIESYDLNHAAAAEVVAGDNCGVEDCATFHGSAEQIVRVNAVVVQDGLADAVVTMSADLDARVLDERSRLSAMLADLESVRREGVALLDAAAHLPIRRPAFVGEKRSQTIAALAALIDSRRDNANLLLGDDLCAKNDCANAHAAAVGLAATHSTTIDSGLLVEIRERQAAVDQQRIDDGAELAATGKQLARWDDAVVSIHHARRSALDVMDKGVSTMLDSAVQVSVGRSKLDLVPVGAPQQPVLGALRLLKEQPISHRDDAALTEALTLAKEFAQVRKSFDATWSCDRRCGSSHKALADAVRRAPAIQEVLDRLMPSPAGTAESFELLVDPDFGFADYLPEGCWPTDLLDSTLTADACERASELAYPGKAAEVAAEFAKVAAERVRAADVARALKAMDLDVLRRATRAGVRIGPLASAGLASVWDVLKYSEKYYLEDLNGLGQTSATSLEQAARRLHDAVRDDTPVRIDVKERGKQTTRLLDTLRDWGLSRDEPSIDERALAKAFLALSESAVPPQQVLVIANQRAEHVPVAELERSHLGRRFPDLDGDIWDDFLTRPADYFGMLTELGFMTEDEKKMHGDLPEEIIEAVRAKELKREFLKPTLSLRAYQSFGARFVLVQKKAVIGDEMGLGKTVEALAVMAHLRAAGQTHFVVVCPAAVVSNWVNETHKHTTLPAHRLQGGQWERTVAAKAWVRSGGVAVVTYDVLSWARQFVRQADVGCAVFDEAHYIKNPAAKRSLEAQDLIDRVSHAVLMTGTPLENSVQEFRNIIGYLRPELAASAPDYLPTKFRKHVAPAYLRRNQEDVLTELPELVEVDEWLPMSSEDEQDYRTAVEASHFMLMRRAAMLSSQSTKLNRLVEIVAEAEANDRRVVVFSYFREVLEAVARALPGRVFGPLTGSVVAARRQTLVDEFSKASSGAVLVAQIGAGGVGLNIQSASVVVLCEPQLKPTTEDQAIARAHRMGQKNTVQVHRLLTEGSVDERIREILTAKREVFDNFARDSVIAKKAPDAVDVSEAELTRLVVAAERERLLGTA